MRVLRPTAAFRRALERVWFRASDTELVLVTITTEPPVPVDE